MMGIPTSGMKRNHGHSLETQAAVVHSVQMTPYLAGAGRLYIVPLVATSPFLQWTRERVPGARRGFQDVSCRKKGEAEP